jgi:ribosomal protein S18 acetylase RimI-like enzyme
VDEGGKTIASCFCGVVPENLVNKLESLPMNDSNTKSIMGFYVMNNSRGKGFGKFLMQEIIKKEKEKGTQYLTLGVSKNNEKAINLYKNCGFVIEGNCSAGEGYHFMYLDLNS